MRSVASWARTSKCLRDRKSTRLNSSHSQISYAVFCLKKKKKTKIRVAIEIKVIYQTIIDNHVLISTYVSVDSYVGLRSVMTMSCSHCNAANARLLVLS